LGLSTGNKRNRRVATRQTCADDHSREILDLSQGKTPVWTRTAPLY
jgi:hypothetical protein